MFSLHPRQGQCYPEGVKRFLMIPAAACIGLPGLADTPIASVICDDRDSMRVRLEQNYGATRQGRGMRGPDAIIEIWAIPGTGDWTLVQNYADGRSCILAIGEDWESLAPARDPA